MYKASALFQLCFYYFYNFISYRSFYPSEEYITILGRDQLSEARLGFLQAIIRVETGV